MLNPDVKKKEQENCRNYYYKNRKKEIARKIADAKKDNISKLKSNISSLVRKSFRVKGYTKLSKTHEILGCDWDTFKIHLERQFLPGMTWENRSEWHIDHIVPLASAKTEDDVIKLNHYTNLRPLWAKDNLEKGAKMEKLL